MDSHTTTLKRPPVIVAGLGLALIAAALVMRSSVRVPHPAPPSASMSTESARGTLADQRLRAAQETVRQAPADAHGYHALTAAYMQKARETGDFGFNAKAQAAIERAEALAPGDFDGLKLRAWVLLTYHDFDQALQVAQQARQMRPQDHEIYGALVDAFVELGRYEEAGTTAQAMIDMHPDAAAYARVSYLRSLHGDTDGAIAAMQLAADAASPRDIEAVAWYRVHLAAELMNAGRFAEAEREVDRALATFPNYHLGLAAKARLRAARGDTAMALDLYVQAEHRVPLPDTVIALGDLYTLLGRPDDARRQYALLEFIENASAPGSATYSRQLALFWADHGLRLGDALAIARRERAARADIYASDLLAWCLFKAGDFAAAKQSSDEALRLGTRDARLYYHAGMIDQAVGDSARAAEYLRRALATNPAFDVLQVDVARRMLADMGSTLGGTQ